MDKHEPIHSAVLHGAAAIKGGAGVAVSGGLWAWFGQNHSQIGAMCAMVGAMCALGGLVFSIYRDRRDNADAMKEDELNELFKDLDHEDGL